MIKSKHVTVGCYGTLLICFLLLVLILLNTLTYFSIIPVNFNISGKSFLIKSAVLIFVLALTLFTLSVNLKLIVIDPDKQIISFKNIFTRKQTVYSFADFNEVVDVSFTHRYQSDFVGLLLNNKPIRYINRGWVSNYAEFEDFLKSIKPYTEKKFGWFPDLKLVRDKVITDYKNAFK